MKEGDYWGMSGTRYSSYRAEPRERRGGRGGGHFLPCLVLLSDFKLLARTVVQSVHQGVLDEFFRAICEKCYRQVRQVTGAANLLFYPTNTLLNYQTYFIHRILRVWKIDRVKYQTHIFNYLLRSNFLSISLICSPDLILIYELREEIFHLEEEKHIYPREMMKIKTLHCMHSRPSGLSPALRWFWFWFLHQSKVFKKFLKISM